MTFLFAMVPTSTVHAAPEKPSALAPEPTSPSASSEQKDFALVSVVTKAGKAPEGFQLKSDRFEVQPSGNVSQSQNPIFRLTIEGTFHRPQWTASFQGQKVSDEGSGVDFSAPCEISSELGTIEVVFQSPIGEEERAQLVIHYGNYPAPAIPALQMPDQPKTTEPALRSKSSNPNLSFGTSLELMDYRQTFLPSLAATLINFSATVTRPLWSTPFDVGTDIRASLPISASAGRARPTVLHIGGRGGYRVRDDFHPYWSFRIDSGIYYETMLVTGAEYGYRNLTGLELLPQARRNYGAGTLDVYMKFAMSLNYFPHSLGSGEYTLGGRWHFHTIDNRESAWNAHFNMSLLIVKMGSVTVNSTNTMIGAGYDFR